MQVTSNTTIIRVRRIPEKKQAHLPPAKIVGKIAFGLLDPKITRGQSAARVITPHLYDEDGLSLSGGLLDPKFGPSAPGERCATCGNREGTCPGHVGHVELARPVVHPGFTLQVWFALQLTCWQCHRLLLTVASDPFHPKRVQEFLQLGKESRDEFRRGDESCRTLQDAARQLVQEGGAGGEVIRRKLWEMFKDHMHLDPQDSKKDYNEFAQAADESGEKGSAFEEPCPHCRAKPRMITLENPTTFYEEEKGQGPRPLTPAEVVDSIERGDHRRRRNVVLTYPVPPELQVKLATHWDFATRLALIGNPGTITSVITTLSKDPQPCVSLAAAARVRRGAATLEPLFGEILDPGELVWLLSSHPGLFFEFGVTTWGDGSALYRNWFKTRLHENTRRRYLLGQQYSWAYSEGIFLEDCERGPRGSHLVYYGLTDHACGQLPCLYLGFDVLNPQYGDIQRLEL